MHCDINVLGASGSTAWAQVLPPVVAVPVWRACRCHLRCGVCRVCASPCARHVVCLSGQFELHFDEGWCENGKEEHVKITHAITFHILFDARIEPAAPKRLWLWAGLHNVDGLSNCCALYVLGTLQARLKIPSNVIELPPQLLSNCLISAHGQSTVGNHAL
jgi:hypothetical protein